MFSDKKINELIKELEEKKEYCYPYKDEYDLLDEIIKKLKSGKIDFHNVEEFYPED